MTAQAERTRTEKAAQPGRNDPKQHGFVNRYQSLLASRFTTSQSVIRRQTH